jgi:predicted DNA-binding transcriptional regulator AlpA
VAVDQRIELKIVLSAARELPLDELPRFLGNLEEIRCTAMARLVTPASAVVLPDQLLDVDEAARRLGMSKDYLYRRHDRFPFTRRVGRNLRFSARGIEEYISHKDILTARRLRRTLEASELPTRG